MKQTITRNASDNEYLHQDFHGALSIALDYLGERYEEQDVTAFLRRFAEAYYLPLRTDVRLRGLVALKQHFEKIYSLEGGEIEVTFSEDELVLEVHKCPAVTHMRTTGYPVSRFFVETESTVNAVLCEGTPFAYELLEYDADTGRSVQRFWRPQ